MNLSPKYIVAIVLLSFTILGWNAFLIVRDVKLFNAYNKACSQLSQPHPDCRYSK
jgi:hypothetical protein